MNDNKQNNSNGGKTLSRRTFLKALGLGTATAAAPAIVSCATGDDRKAPAQEPPVGKMTYRENPKTKEKVSILGYGMMRLPTKVDNSDEFDQEMINKQRNVLTAFTQGRQVEVDKVDAVEEVLAERMFHDHCLQVGICGTDHAHISPAGMAVAQHLVGLVLQHPQ